MDGQSHLLLIREDAAPPDAQVLRVCVCVCVREQLICKSLLPEHVNIYQTRAPGANASVRSTVQQLGRRSPPGLQSGKRGQFSGAVPALQSALHLPLRHPGHSGRHSRSDHD